MALQIIIVNYRTPGLTIDCLRSLQPQVAGLEKIRVCVVENGSGDDSEKILAGAIAKEGWDSWAELVTADGNRGFAAGNNLAIQRVLASADPPDYLLLLNPDTIARSGAIAALLRFMQMHPEVGIAGSRLEHLDGTVQTSSFRFPTWISEFEHGLGLGVISRLMRRWVVAGPIPEGNERADWVCGGSMIVRREVFDAIGLLDEQYFMYFEEVDFCRRAQLANWPCWYCPESRVVHLVGQSSGFTKRTRQRRPRYWFDSRSHFFRKNYGRGRKLLADLAWASGYALFRMRALVQQKKVEDPAWLWWDFVRYNFGLRGWQRRRIVGR